MLTAALSFVFSPLQYSVKKSQLLSLVWGITQNLWSCQADKSKLQSVIKTKIIDKDCSSSSKFLCLHEGQNYDSASKHECVVGLEPHV